MIVEGAIFLERLISERLCDYIYIGPRPAKAAISDLEAGQRKVAQLFRAIKTCSEDLELFYTNLKPATYPFQSAAPHFQNFVNKQNLACHLQYTAQLHRNRTDRALFKAKMTMNEEVREVIVKFSYRYGKAGHELLAGFQLAPELHFCEFDHDLMMHIVVMDFIKELDDAKPSDPTYFPSLKKAIELLHAQDLVFGDLRPENVLLDAAGIKLIDFDWCGRVGEVHYPGDMNLDADKHWPPNVSLNDIITKADDVYMLGQLQHS